jgi:hypothetical protein
MKPVWSMYPQHGGCPTSPNPVLFTSPFFMRQRIARPLSAAKDLRPTTAPPVSPTTDSTRKVATRPD